MSFYDHLETGDLITHLDDKSILGLNLSDAVKKMRGRVGSKIKLTIVREEKDPFEVIITRDIIKIQSVKSRIEGNIGFTMLYIFPSMTMLSGTSISAWPEP